MRTKLIKNLCYVVLFCSFCSIEQVSACNRHQRRIMFHSYGVNRHGNIRRHHYRAAKVEIITKRTPAVLSTDSLACVANKPSSLAVDGAGRHLSSWVTFVSPEQRREVNSEGKVCGMITPDMEEILSGKYGKSDTRLCTELNALISNLRKQSGLSVNSVQITGYSCPKGNPLKSEKASMKRISEVKEMFRRNFMASEVPVKVGWIGEDWDTLSVLIKSSDIPMREAVMGIVNTQGISENREHMLSLLDRGIPYSYIKQRLYGKVERMKYEVEYTIKSKDGEELKEDSDGISYRRLYTTACRYARETKMFADLMDLGARLYPDNAGANINAGAVALLHRNTVLARKYLTRYATNRDALGNMGILCLLEGNMEKASLYLQMASDAGSVPARSALEYLMSHKEEKKEGKEIKSNVETKNVESSKQLKKSKAGNRMAKHIRIKRGRKG